MGFVLELVEFGVKFKFLLKIYANYMKSCFKLSLELKLKFGMN